MRYILFCNKEIIAQFTSKRDASDCKEYLTELYPYDDIELIDIEEVLK